MFAEIVFGFVVRTPELCLSENDRKIIGCVLGHCKFLIQREKF